jgi:hypothetical protein
MEVTPFSTRLWKYRGIHCLDKSEGVAKEERREERKMS